MLHRSKADDDPALQRRNFMFFCRAVSTAPSPGLRRSRRAGRRPRPTLPQGARAGVSISFVAALPRCDRLTDMRDLCILMHI
jgi:hypothetical protein